MGLDLRLLPFDVQTNDFAFSHTVLSCAREYDLFGPIQAIAHTHGRPVPARFNTFISRDGAYDDAHYGPTQETPYGEPLLEVEVEDLLPLASLARHPRNKAVWAYLAQLPTRTKVALYWH